MDDVVGRPGNVWSSDNRPDEGTDGHMVTALVGHRLLSWPSLTLAHNVSAGVK